MAATLVRDLVAFSVQIALVTVAIAVLLKLVRIPARVRYVGLRVALVALLVAPWLLRVPEHLPAAEAGTSSVAAPASPLALAAGASARADETSQAAPRTWNIPWAPVLLGALLIGVVARGLWLVAGFARLRRLTRLGTVVDADYAELQQQMGTRATITEVVGVAQPATFGVRRPVVMLPDALAAAPESLRRAVITHELFHVRRCDWLSVLAEEMVRTLLWFHPAILWLTSHIQLAREEIVDELTVRATGDRRTYMQALLSFADTPGLSPAPAFAHRRQLFHRILSVSKENVMSRPRIATSAVALMVVVAGVSWYASALFPIVAASRPDTVAMVSAVSPLEPRLQHMASVVISAPPDRSFTRIEAGQDAPRQAAETAEPRQVTPENPIPRRTRAISPRWPPAFAAGMFEVAISTRVTLDRQGAVTAVERRGCAVSTSGSDESVCSTFFDAAAEAIRQWRYEQPIEAPVWFNVVVTFLRPGSEPAVTHSGTPLGVDASLRGAWPTSSEPLDVARLVEQARALRTDSASQTTPEALAERLAELNDELRELERAQRLALELLNPDRAEQARLQREFASLVDQFAKHLTELKALRARQAASQTPSPSRWLSPSGRVPERVGGAVTTPRVISGPKPEYTPEAMQARVEGTVVMEVLVDEDGRVPDARVIRSIPLLDQTALDTVKTWRFTPAQLNGTPVPVLVIVELDFNLRESPR